MALAQTSERTAITAGALLPPNDEVPATLIDAVAARLGDWPEGTIWNCDDTGQLQGAAYAALWSRSLILAAGMAARGIGPGRIVALAVSSALEFVPAFWACLRAGCIILPLSGRARQVSGEALVQVLAAIPDPVVLAEAGSRARDTAHRLGLTSFTLDELEAMGGEQAPAAGAPPAGRSICLMPTSGSTGRMKLAALSEATLIARRFLRRRPAVDPHDAQLLVFDQDSVTGMDGVFVPGPRLVLVPPSVAAGRPLAIPDAIEAQGVVRLNLTCSLAGLVAEAVETSGRHWDLSSLKRITLGAETVDRRVAVRLAQAFGRHGAQAIELLGAYGATETGALASAARLPAPPAAGEDAGPLRLGAPPAGVTLRIVGEDGEALSEGEVGLIEAHAPGLMFSGYWGEDGATAAAYSPGGWYRTGDLGALSGGRLDLHGRAKEMIIARGAKHALADIDAALQGAAREALPSRAEGARLLACEVRRPGEATEQLAAVVFSAEALAPGERKLLEPALRRAAAGRFGLGLKSIAYAPMERLPLGPGGKVMRRELAALLPAATSPSADAAAPTDEDWLEALWRQVLACPGPVAPDSDFLELGGDSLASAQLFAALETRLGRRIAPDRFFAAPTFASLRALVADHEGGGSAVRAAPGADWPLPATLRDKLLVRMEVWPGARPTRDRLVAGLNLDGARPPLFWIFQGADEFAALGEALGPDQPLYGFRSGHLVFRYTEDQIQQTALAYVQDVLEARPSGPLALGGNCQGGIIALAMAQHLQRRRREPRLLVLMEWAFQPHPYPGQVLFLDGRNNPQTDAPNETPNPWPGLGGAKRREIPGAHGGFFWPGNVEGLAAILAEHLQGR